HTAVQERERQEARLRAAQRDLIQIQTRLSAAQGELARLQRQFGDRNRVLTARKETVAQALHKVETTERLLEERQQLFEEARQEVEMLVAGREDLARGISEGQSALEAARAAEADTQRGRHAAMDRLALLEEWKSALQGADDGARRLRSAPANADHPPIIGVLSELIRAPESFELAIEAALGPLLYALVVRTRVEAHRCAEWLRRNHGGRAHFLWMDGTYAALPKITEAPVADNVEAFGFARDLVESETEFDALVRRILGDTYVVRDLTAADYLWPTTSPSFPVATLGGDVLHPNSWLLTAGSQSASGSTGATESSILARERELRQLPEHISQLDTTITKLSDRVRSMVILQDERKHKAEALHKELVRTEELAQELAKSVTGMQREQERAQSELQVNTSVAEQLLAELRDIEQEMSAINSRVLEHEAEQLEANERLLDIQTEVDEALASSRHQQEALATARTTAALHQQEVRILGQRVEQLRTQLHELEVQMNRRRQRREAIELQRAELQETSTAESLNLAELRGRVQNLGEQLHEHDVRQSDLERQIYRLEHGQISEREELARVEVEYRRSIVDSQQARDAILTLTEQMRDELESEEMSDPCESSQLSPILELKDELDEPVLTLEEAGRLRRQIDQLRNRIKHLGGYDPEAPRAYEELKIRYDFMTSQVQDMEQASQNLRAIIGELDVTMRRRFEETFHMVNERFQRHFVTLFSGGSARLELTPPKRQQTEDEGDETPDGPRPAPKPNGFGGVEVFVQIPGKKVQDLSLLSGGERALVSAALLFALLETSPPPFCLLDEVDAALDEANVMRFCEILEQLAQQTQFIVITHNRVTMTHSDAIYGISMGGDSVSRVLSMRLADVRQGDLMGNSR
ncbi:MAG: AAA family ATPase, partial [Ktedonobacterales bacterium]